MAQSRHHSPNTGRGKERRRKPEGGAMPLGIAPSWPAKASFIPVGVYRRKAKPIHPGCATDKHPHRAFTRQWLRDGLTLEQATDLVRIKWPGDAVAERALRVYAANRLTPVGEPVGAAFPLTARDLRNVRASNALVLMGPEVEDDE